MDRSNSQAVNHSKKPGDDPDIFKTSGLPGDPAMRRPHSDEDERNAFEWLEKAASQGNSDAQILCRGMDIRGGKFPTGAGTAFGWLENAAAQGNPDAEVLLRWLKVRQVPSPKGPSDEADEQTIARAGAAASNPVAVHPCARVKHGSLSPNPFFAFPLVAAGLALLVFFLITGPYTTEKRKVYDGGGSITEVAQAGTGQEHRYLEIKRMVEFNKLLLVATVVFLAVTVVANVGGPRKILAAYPRFLSAYRRVSRRRRTGRSSDFQLALLVLGVTLVVLALALAVIMTNDNR